MLFYVKDIKSIMRLTKSSRKEICLEFGFKAGQRNTSTNIIRQNIQSEGADTTKAREPLDDLDLGTSSNISLRDLRSRYGLRYLISSVIYDGAWPWIASKVRSAVLKAQRWSTGNQCRDLRTGVMWLYIFVLDTIQAVELKTYCNLVINDLEIPWSRELQ